MFDLCFLFFLLFDKYVGVDFFLLYIVIVWVNGGEFWYGWVFGVVCFDDGVFELQLWMFE